MYLGFGLRVLGLVFEVWFEGFETCIWGLVYSGFGLRVMRLVLEGLRACI